MSLFMSNNMEYTQLLCIISFVVPILLLFFGLLKYYEPKIDIVVTSSYYKVFLWYDSYEGPEYKGRIYKCLSIKRQ